MTREGFDKINSSKARLADMVDKPPIFQQKKTFAVFQTKKCNYSWRWFCISFIFKKKITLEDWQHQKNKAISSAKFLQDNILLLHFILYLFYFMDVQKSLYFFPLNTFSLSDKALGMKNELFMRKHCLGYDRVKLFPLSSVNVP